MAEILTVKSFCGGGWVVGSDASLDDSNVTFGCDNKFSSECSLAHSVAQSSCLLQEFLSERGSAFCILLSWVYF